MEWDTLPGCEPTVLGEGAGARGWGAGGADGCRPCHWDYAPHSAPEHKDRGCVWSWGTATTNTRVLAGPGLQNRKGSEGCSRANVTQKGGAPKSPPLSTCSRQTLC